jgi:Gas vesicle protein
VSQSAAISARSGAGVVGRAGAAREVALIDLLDRLLQGGVAIHGEIMLSVAGVDLVELDLRVLVASVDTVAGR